MNGPSACPDCGKPLVGESGFVRWCGHCDWNVEPACVRRDGDLREPDLFDLLEARHGTTVFLAMLERPPSRRRRSAGSVAFLAIAAVVCCINVALIVGGFAILVVTQFSPLMWLIAMPVVALGLFGIVRGWRQYPVRVLVEREAAPQLHALVAEICRAESSPAVRRIELGTHWDVTVRRSGIAGWSLAIGAPLWYALGPAERVAMLAHAIGRIGSGDPRRGRIAQRAALSLDDWRQPTEFDSEPRGRRWLMLPFLRVAAVVRPITGLRRVLLPLVFADALRSTYIADRRSAEIASSVAASRVVATLSHGYVSAEFILERWHLGGHEGSLWDLLQDQLAVLPLSEMLRQTRATELDLSVSTNLQPAPGHRVMVLDAHPVGSARVAIADTDALDNEMLPFADRVAHHLQFGLDRPGHLGTVRSV